MAEVKPQGATSVDDYFSRLPEDRAAALNRVRLAVHAAIPGLTETMAYGMPTF